jgi:hypothetical protein
MIDTARQNAGGGVDVIVQSQHNLFHVVLTLSPSGGFACLLNCWKQQCNQNRNDRDYHKKLDQCEATLCSIFARHKLTLLLKKFQQESLTGKRSAFCGQFDRDEQRRPVPRGGCNDCAEVQ